MTDSSRKTAYMYIAKPFLPFPGDSSTWVLQITLSSSPPGPINMESFRIVSSIKEASSRFTARDYRATQNRQ